MQAEKEPGQSYWQIGCEDGKHGRGPKRPFPNNGTAFVSMFSAEARANESYMNGYRFGATHRYEPVDNEGSEP